MQAERAAAAAAGDREARAAAATMAEASREGRMPPPVDPVGYVPTYYPRAVLPAFASAVLVGLGAQVFGIDLRLEITKTGSVSGTVMSADGFGARVSADELRRETARPILLALAANGRPLSRADGLVRLIVPGETDDALRQVKWVSEIRLQ